MEIETTVEVEVDEYEVLDRMKTKDIIEYLKDERDCRDLATELIKGLSPMQILASAVYPFLPRNCSDKQSVMDAVQEYLSREYN